MTITIAMAIEVGMAKAESEAPSSFNHSAK
jgi:hypothetical protein